LKHSNPFIITSALAFAIGIGIGFFKADSLPLLLPVVCLLFVVLAVFWFTSRNSFYNSSSAQEKLPKVFTYKETPILILDSVGVFPEALQEPVVVLTQNTQIHLARFIDSVSPVRIIADGSNYKSYVDRWRQTCIEKKIPFHSTYEKGAFIWQ